MQKTADNSNPQNKFCIYFVRRKKEKEETGENRH